MFLASIYAWIFQQNTFDNRQIQLMTGRQTVLELGATLAKQCERNSPVRQSTGSGVTLRRNHRWVSCNLNAPDCIPKRILAPGGCWLAAQHSLQRGIQTNDKDTQPNVNRTLRSSDCLAIVATSFHSGMHHLHLSLIHCDLQLIQHSYEMFVIQ